MIDLAGSDSPTRERKPSALPTILRFAQAHAANGSAATQKYYTTTQAAVRDLGFRTKHALIRARADSRSWVISGVTALGSRTMRFGEFARRMRDHRVRITFQKNARFKHVVRRVGMLLLPQLAGIKRDQRAWTAMGMAALSALLTLGVISSVSHYAPSAAKKDLPAVSSQSSTVPASAVVVRNPASHGNKASSLRYNEPSPSPKPAPTVRRSSGAPSPALRRVHRTTGEDDYVAPDTYRYYGTNGSR